LVNARAYLLREAFGLEQNQIHSHRAMIESQLMKPINPTYYANICYCKQHTSLHLENLRAISHLSVLKVKEHFLAAYIIVRTSSMKTKNPHAAMEVFVKKMIFDQG
jgi:hypothetical protein